MSAPDWPYVLQGFGANCLEDLSVIWGLRSRIPGAGTGLPRGFKCFLGSTLEDLSAFLCHSPIPLYHSPIALDYSHVAP